ncbi:MAG: Smr/MutS family protein [Kiritimatiellae bacterium]|nr:Smr/MutS family protein [Kiritimatiellia bacterium]
MKRLKEYDLHPGGMRVDEALARLERIVSQERAAGEGVFAVVTGHGSSGGTALIKDAVLAACAEYKRLRHIRGFLDGFYAGDIFSVQALDFPDLHALPPHCKRSPNPGVVFIAV